MVTIHKQLVRSRLDAFRVSPLLTLVPALLSLSALVLGSAPARAQSRFATQVVNYSPGPGGGIFVPTNVLGGPQGAGLDNGSLDVTTLGVGGSLTLGFDVTIADGPGVDFIVFENGFESGGGVFSEVAWVEVSTDGVHFARVPNRYAGPANGLPGFVAPYGTYAGLPGGMPVLANVVTNSIDPFDPSVAGGDAIDLAALAGDPLVVAGLVDLSAIHFVRLVDIPDGSGLDSHGNVIWDNSGPTGTADFDAVAVIQHTGTITPTQPIVDLFFDASGYLNLELEDPNGFSDLRRSTLHASLDLRPLTYARLRQMMPVLRVTSRGVLMRSSTPYVGSGRMGVLSVSIRDASGQFSADQIALQG
jgi:hypothetical protein